MQVVFGLVVAVDLVEEVAAELEASASVAVAAVAAVALVLLKRVTYPYLRARRRALSRYQREESVVLSLCQPPVGELYLNRWIMSTRPELYHSPIIQHHRFLISMQLQLHPRVAVC